MKIGDDEIVPPTAAAKRVAEVIDLNGVRIQWGLPATPLTARCQHKSIVYSTIESRVWCQDCNKTIDNFAAFMTFVKNFEGMERAARFKLDQAEEAMKTSARKRATKLLDQCWSGNVMAPSCPHCRGGLLPEDFADGAMSACSREIELARRARLRK